MILQQKIDDVILLALKEDMNYGDITTDILITNDQISKAKLIAKEKGVIAGCEIFQRVFKLLNGTIEIIFYKNDGDYVQIGDVIGEIFGQTKAILKAERTALNIIQRLSGIATMTNDLVRETEGIPVRIVDTRKTTPGLRDLEKYAVRVGGGYNHRFNLSDAVMIKDNHIHAVGSIKKAVEIAQANIPHTMKVEVEVENLDQLQEALEAKADIIMLDNMTTKQMKEAVSITDGQAILEASGNITDKTVKDIAHTGIQVISVGLITHSVKALDISLKFSK